MRMSLDSAYSLNLIQAYESGKATIRNTPYTDSLIVFPEDIETQWPVTDINSLKATDFNTICQFKPEVLIIGSGDKLVFPHPKTFVTLIDFGIGYEVMDNAAACRTFNIVVGEGRKAVLALII